MKQRNRKRILGILRSNIFFANDTTQKVTLSLETETDAEALILTVDGTNVTLINNKGVIQLIPGKHKISWRVIGNEGATYSITGRANDNVVVEIKNQKLGADGMDGGVEEFEI